jgi:flagellar biosynthesis protein FlhF
MRLKSYFAGSIEGALKQARREMGQEAMLLDSHRSGPESRHLGEYEVVCAVLPARTAPREPMAASAEPLQPAFPQNEFRGPSLDQLCSEVSDLKRYMERMAATIARSSAGFASLRSNPELMEAFAVLNAAEVDSSMAYDMVSGIADSLTGEPSQLRRLLTTEIEKLLRVEPVLGKPGASQKIVALIGPPGVGKTTTLVKLAARYGLAARRPAHILTLDTYRVAAVEQLRSYAAILGVGFQVVETPAALAQNLEEHRSKDLILIDTPGFARNEMNEASDMATFLSTHPAMDTHLVLPASLKSADMKRVAEQYGIFRPAKLLFTRMDETESFGALLNVVVRCGKPVSFVCSGQQVPDDLDVARKEHLAKLILRAEYFDTQTKAAMAAA